MTAAIQNRPIALKDANFLPIYDSVDYLAFRGEYDGSSNLIYAGFSRPGFPTSNNVWQIFQLNYDVSNNLISILWPVTSQGVASNDYVFAWDSRGSYVYA